MIPSEYERKLEAALPDAKLCLANTKKGTEEHAHWTKFVERIEKALVKIKVEVAAINAQHAASRLREIEREMLTRKD